MKLTITYIANDEDCYLYEVDSDNFNYYVARYKEETDLGEADYSNKYFMHNRSDFTDREWEIADLLFNFLWTSENGTNTCMDKDWYEEDGFSKEEIAHFIYKYQFDDAGVLEMYEDGGVEIYWDYFSCFNLKTCKFTR